MISRGKITLFECSSPLRVTADSSKHFYVVRYPEDLE